MSLGALETVGPRQRAHFAGTSRSSVVEAFRFSREARGSPGPEAARWQVQWKAPEKDWNLKRILKSMTETYWDSEVFRFWEIWFTQRFLKTVRCAAWGRRRCTGLKSLVFWSKIQKVGSAGSCFRLLGLWLSRRVCTALEKAVTLISATLNTSKCLHDIWQNNDASDLKHDNASCLFYLGSPLCSQRM